MMILLLLAHLVYVASPSECTMTFCASEQIHTKGIIVRKQPYRYDSLLCPEKQNDTRNG